MRSSHVVTTNPQSAVTGPDRWRLGVLLVAQFVLIVDVVVVNVALPSISDDLDIPAGRLTLVSVAYTLTFGSLLILFGRTGDLIGRRRLFLIGLSTFTIASAVTGLAQNEWQLLAARAGQGIGAAMVSPAALALLTTSFADEHARNRALGLWGAVGSAGAIAGQLVGGLLTDTLGWRSIFLINIPIGIVALIAAARHLTEHRTPRTDMINPTSATGFVIALATATLVLTRIAERADTTITIALVVVAIVAATVFVVSERGHQAPLIDINVIRSGNIAAANALLAITAGTIGAALFFTTLYLQDTLEYTPLAVGAGFAPITVAILLISPHVGTRAHRIGHRRLIAVGFALIAAGLALLARLPDHGTYLRDVLPPLLLVAIGSALCYAPTFILGTTSAPDEKQGLTAGLINSSQELGAAIGVATFGALATTIATNDSETLTGYRSALLAAAAVAAITIPTLIRRLPPRAMNREQRTTAIPTDRFNTTDQNLPGGSNKTH